MKININKIKELENNGLLRIQTNNSSDLMILNYTQDVQYHKSWNPLLKMCRGLVIDNDGNIISRSMSKFFNHFELENNPELGTPPDLPFKIWEKLDGCLISLFWCWWKNAWIVTSRGSFNSEHAQKAKKLFSEKYPDYIKLDKTKTYNFELISPEFRIVVDYGNIERLVLLACIDIEIGDEENIENINWPDKPKKYDGITDINELLKMYDNNEGFVLHYQNNFRMKVKFEEYFKLHRVITGLNNVTIWEMLKNNDDIDEILENLPDEFFEWFENEMNELKLQFKNIKNNVTKCWKCHPECETRKELAMWIKEQEYSQFMFPLIDKKNIDKMIWKYVKPKHSKRLWGEIK